MTKKRFSIIEAFIFFTTVFLAVAIICFGGGEAYGEDIRIKFIWDADVEDVEGQKLLWETLNLYQRSAPFVDGTSTPPPYDYTSPAATFPQTYVDGKSVPTEYDHVVDAAAGVITKFYWVIRSGNGDLESEDSDEVSLRIDLTPLQAFVFTAVYNDVANSIDFAWSTEDSRATKWRIFHSTTQGGPYEVLTTTTESGTSSIPIDELFPKGQKTIQYFTMVSFGKYDVYSPNATEVAITIDRLIPQNVINFRIFLE